ncbi:MAG: Asp23/Gls24 family envelope stress response protein [Gaiellaceae bacterium]
MELPRIEETRLGRISISAQAIAQIVERTVDECYGVVDTGPSGRVRRLLALSPTRRVAVNQSNGGLALALRVVVADGLNLAEVASTVRSRVGYEVERLTGLAVSSVEVHIEDVRPLD